MILDKKIEQEALTAYIDISEMFLSLNIPQYMSVHDEDPIIIGTTSEEWFEDKEQLKQALEIIKDQIGGKVDFRNREIKAKLIDQHHCLITEKCDLYVEINGGWVFLYQIRGSTILRKKEGKWLIFHQHSSVPDQHTVSGETLPYAKLKGEYDELKEAIKKRTIELEESLAKLKATQSQLIQSEKLASLGELTAGIAHEIQNPLNFVNNFSELSVDLAEELKDEIKKPEKDWELIEDLTNDLTQNQEKINHYGKRAAAIVTGMLQHARTSSGKKEPTDLNALADEYFRLSYHGLRAKDSAFNAKLETDFDLTIGKVDVIPQDIGRVFLNIINNAFYAVQQRAGASDGVTSSHPVTTRYEPTVSISSRMVPPSGGQGAGAGQVVFKIKDNGTGIPDDVKARIFQPFFTTKPTGQGTGLGLSISYDIVVKGHGGSMTVESAEGKGTEFIIHLPIN